MRLNVKKGVLNAVVQAIGLNAAELGFVKKGSGRRLFKPITPHITGVIDITSATGRGDGTVYVGITMQLIHDELEREICRLRNAPFNMQHLATLGRSIGYLMPDPQWREWPVVDFPDVDNAAREIVTAIALYGVPYLEQHATLAALHDGVRKRLMKKSLCYADFVIPVILKALNRTDEAVKFLSEQLRKLEDDTDMASENYCKFARRFLAENPL